LNQKKRAKRKLTQEIISEIQKLSFQGYSILEICKQLELKSNTLKKAIKKGLITLLVPDSQRESSNTKSDRNIKDSQTTMGKACTNTVERVLAFKTGMNCPVKFSQQTDLNKAGVLLALPALLANGLLNNTSDFEKESAYYSADSVFLSLAFLSLLRIKTLAQSGSVSCGELGRVLGLDRIPEVKTLRNRIAFFANTGNVKKWAMDLSHLWLNNNDDLSGILYIYGHVNIYYGEQTKMPKRFVSRMRLCMRGSTDYYVNDRLGQPFFVVNKEISGSMIETIKKEIIPQLELDVPNQPDTKELETNPLLCKFMIITDRECYSPEFIGDLWDKRISLATYKKNVKDKWDEAEFTEYEEIDVNGNTIKVWLAERGTLMEYKKKETQINAQTKIETTKNNSKQLWVREVRKKSESGHQTAIITTNFMLKTVFIGIYMFARWSQENFFKYMIENFGIDTLVSYLKRKVDDTTMLVNPQYRDMDAQQKKLVSTLNIRKAKFATLILENTEIEDKMMPPFIKKKTDLMEEIEQLKNEISVIKEKKILVERKITFSQLPENEKFTNAINERKHFLDTIKMIAYRSETAMANIIKKEMSNPEHAKVLLKQIYSSDANLKPDYNKKILTVELHRLNTWQEDKIVEFLCNELNQTETAFPGTDLVLFFKLVSI